MSSPTLVVPVLKLSGSLILTDPSYFISLFEDISFVFSYLFTNWILVSSCKDEIPTKVSFNPPDTSGSFSDLKKIKDPSSSPSISGKIKLIIFSWVTGFFLTKLKNCLELLLSPFTFIVCIPTWDPKE